MSSLWIKHVTRKFFRINKPSPANEKVFVKRQLSQPYKDLCSSVKRMSLFISQSANVGLHGSMTIEASLLLPLFMFTFLHLAGVIEMLRLHGKMEFALWTIGNQISVYMDAYPEAIEDVPDIGVSYLLVHGQLVKMLGGDYLDESPLVHGKEGLNFLRSEYPDEEECVDILVTYQVAPILTLFPFGYKRMNNRYYGRAWTGYDVAETGSLNSRRYVYITSEGEVWHSTPICSYIYHQVFGTTSMQIKSMRNRDGKAYEPCSLCMEYVGGTQVFYTKEGEKYHYAKKCTAIYKEITAIVWEKGLSYRPCSRCAGEENNGKN